MMIGMISYLNGRILKDEHALVTRGVKHLQNGRISLTLMIE